MTRPAVTLEVCLDSVESAVAARDGGAGRIELCAAMADGGITPSCGLVAAVRRAVRIRLHVLVRPRPGDFVYSGMELRAMADDIRAAKDLGAEGVVVGALTARRAVDSGTMERLIRAAEPMSVTFHRAFDEVRRRDRALEALIDLGVDRVLTAGAAATAFDGRREIGRLVAQSAGRIAVMAGGGVGHRTAARLVEETGVREVHAGGAVAKPVVSGKGTYRALVSVVSEAKTRALVRVLGVRREDRR